MHTVSENATNKRQNFHVIGTVTGSRLGASGNMKDFDLSIDATLYCVKLQLRQLNTLKRFLIICPYVV